MRVVLIHYGPFHSWKSLLPLTDTFHLRGVCVIPRSMYKFILSVSTVSIYTSQSLWQKPVTYISPHRVNSVQSMYYLRWCIRGFLFGEMIRLKSWMKIQCETKVEPKRQWFLINWECLFCLLSLLFCLVTGHSSLLSIVSLHRIYCIVSIILTYINTPILQTVYTYNSMKGKWWKAWNK